MKKWISLCICLAKTRLSTLNCRFLGKLLPETLAGAPPWSSGSVLDHRSLPPVFRSWRVHIWRVFHLWLRFITFGGRLTHLAYHVHKSGRKTSIIIIQKPLLWVFNLSTYCCILLIKYSDDDNRSNFSFWGKLLTKFKRLRVILGVFLHTSYFCLDIVLNTCKSTNISSWGLCIFARFSFVMQLGKWN